ncbi:hypothetical protein [Calidithermus chliarophilus]|uniref:hypothetical protein n=1 Tax=Calidithermus chliarophilus TaxID=52023 RepID=UPI0012F6CD85|nr:hypothetical protein [Calidithermus chliarophilus]
MGRLILAAFTLFVLVSCNSLQTRPSDGPDAQAVGAVRRVPPKFAEPKAFDVSRALRDMVGQASGEVSSDPDAVREIRPDRGPLPTDQGFSGDAAVQRAMKPTRPGLQAAAIPAPLLTFEGLSNQDNFNLFGFRVNPPDPVGDVGPNHYVEMVNLAFAVYDKQGNLLMGPARIGDLWSGFAIEDCTDPSGDPIVLYDQLEDRWILSQFTTRGLANPALPFYNCVAISQTGDPTGPYYRYAFITQPDPDGGYFFPDYPKYGVWTDSYILTTRDFGTVNGYGISVYALEKNKMLAGNPKARAVQFFLDSDVVPLNLMGDGLLPPDIDGTRRPIDRIAAPIVGTQDNGGFYGAAFDALNVFELTVQWRANPAAALNLAAQLPVAAFDSIFPCAPTSRDCLPQPGIVNPAQYLDILSYRQRPTHRLAYRNFGNHEALVTSQSVEALPGVAGMRWYEIRRSGGVYSVYQQGTFAPNDGVHRWMGSVAMDWQGNVALGYSVVNGVNVYPGIRYTGRLSGDPLGQMTLGEGVIINGSGVQTTTNSRWGDYTSMNIDPADDCTFWYVNEYYTAAGQASSPAGWQTRIGSFKLPGCAPKAD